MKIIIITLSAFENLRVCVPSGSSDLVLYEFVGLAAIISLRYSIINEEKLVTFELNQDNNFYLR